MAFWFVLVHQKEKRIQREENQNKKYNKLFSEQRRDVEQTVSGRYTLSKLILYFFAASSFSPHSLVRSNELLDLRFFIMRIF